MTQTVQGDSATTSGYRKQAERASTPATPHQPVSAATGGQPWHGSTSFDPRERVFAFPARRTFG